MILADFLQEVKLTFGPLRCLRYPRVRSEAVLAQHGIHLSVLILESDPNF